jgi:hypothetical protein
MGSSGPWTKFPFIGQGSKSIEIYSHHGQTFSINQIFGTTIHKKCCHVGILESVIGRPLASTVISLTVDITFALDQSNC